MEKNLYIKGFGINHQNLINSKELFQCVNSPGAIKHILIEDELIKKVSIPLIRQSIDREDRALLNKMSIMSLNSLSDLLSFLEKASEKVVIEGLSCCSIYTSNDDPDIEIDIMSINKLLEKVGVDNVYAELGLINNLSNPLNALRSLTTNSLYHLSKVLKNHTDGHPLATTSLGGIIALYMAETNMFANAHDSALLSTGTNLFNLKNISFWYQANAINFGSGDGITPVWANSTLYVESDKNGSLGKISYIVIDYNPKPFYHKNDWLRLYSLINSNSKVDFIITYQNGIKAQDEEEKMALDLFFPGVKQINYKKKIGYSGIASNYFDIICALLDSSIPVGANILINGAGIAYGLGCILIRKDRMLHTYFE